MVEKLHRRLVPLALAGLVAAVGCQQRQEVADEDADTLMMEDTALPPAPAAPPGPDTGVGGETAAAAAGAVQVSVTNTHPHPMIVSANGEELGTIQPNETRTLDLPAGAAGTVQLTATDEGATHTVEGTVTAAGGEAPSWTIQ